MSFIGLEWKRNVEYLRRYHVCQMVKEKPEHAIWFLNSLPIPKWKWEVISIYFIIGLPRTLRQYDSNMVVEDKLTKVSHIIPIQSTCKDAQVAEVLWNNFFEYMEYQRK